MKTKILFIFLFYSFFSWSQSVFISQYIETDSGTSPKGIEIYNHTASNIVFSAANNLEVYQGINGVACSSLVNITSGTLQAGEVWVIGTSDLTTFATTNGTNLSGTTTYNFVFNGNDALQVYLGGTLQDVFGTCGSNPGTSWSGGGVSTANFNLDFTSSSCVGTTSNWTNPSLRFTQIAAGSIMTGFGNSPASCLTTTPTITTSTTSLTGFTYIVGSGPSAQQTFTVSGSNLTNNIVLTAPTNYEISTTSGTGFTNTVTLSQIGGNVATTTIYIRLITGLAVNIFTGNIMVNSTGVAQILVSLTGSVTASSQSDLLISTGIPATISSLINNNAPLTSATGIQVLRFLVRDGGGTSDADNLPTILTDFTIAQSATNNVGTWSDAINTIELFDGTTRIAAGVVTANQIQFTGLNVIAADNTNKLLALRMSLKCPLGADAFDGEDFGFSISNTNTTFSPSGSGKTTFSAVANANNTNVIAVVATQLRFGTHPTTTSVGNTMAVVVSVRATDSCGNTDLNFTSAIMLNSSGTMTGSPISTNAISGVVSYTGLIHTIPGTGLTLTANSGVLGNVTSNPFNITIATQFSKGDFAVIGVNSNINTCTPTPTGYSNGDDEVSFITFKDIQNGDYFFITDNGYERTNALQWGDSEGLYQITRVGSTINAGTVITFRFLNNSPFMEFNSPDSNWSFTKAPGFPGSLVLNSGGDQIFFMQGGSWNNPAGAQDAVYTPGEFLFAFNTNTSWTSFGNSTQQSGLPLGLRCFSMLPGVATDYIEYTGLTTATSKTDWISRINDPTNWTNRASCNGYTRMHVGQVYGLTSGSTLLPGVWTGKDDENWFDCGNWHNLEVPNETVDVELNSTYSTKDINVNSLAIGASDFGGIAKCKNLTISQRKVKIIASTSNRLEVHGSLLINTNGQLDMNDGVAGNLDGQIDIFGNWTNNRNQTFFNEGEGSVNFVGTTAQNIFCAGGTPESFFNVNLANPTNFTTDNFNSDLIANGNLALSNGSDLIVKTSHYAIAGKNLTIGAGSVLDIENGASLTQIDDSGIVINNGTTTVTKKSTPYVQYDYTFWASPIVDEKIGSVFAANPSPRRYSFSTANFQDLFSYRVTPGDTGFPQQFGVPDSFDDSGDDWVTEIVTNTVTPGRGYSVMGPNASAATGQTIVFTETGTNGRLNNGVKTVSVFKDLYNQNMLNVSALANAAHTNNNLIGNPYPSAIDLVKLKADNALLTGTFYFWTHKTPISTANPGPWLYNFTNDDYVTFTAGTGGTAGSCSGCPVPDRYVDSCQGFWANVTDNGTITFNNSQRVTSNNNALYRTTNNINEDKIWLNFNAVTGETRQILVGFIEGAEDGYNPYYDGQRLENGNNFDFFSYIPSNPVQRLAIQGLPVFNDSKIIPLGIEIKQAGMQSISIDHTEGVFENGQTIYLQDNLTNTIHDFENGAYSFQSEIGSDITDRFLLLFTSTSLSNQDFTNSNTILVFSDINKRIHIKSFVESINEVTIYDMLGREIANQKNNTSKEVIFSNLSVSNQTLIVKIKLENGQIVTRKIII